MLLRLEHIRKEHCPGMSTGDFAQAVTQMHGYPGPGEITGDVIADLEDTNSKTRYPVPLLEEIALYCSRVASTAGSRLIEYQDFAGFTARALPPGVVREYVAPRVVQEVLPEAVPQDDTEPALTAVAG